ncbi:DUF2939 domain-containing protein [uncultured Methylobacterium sp.]|jgi:hypothetical protein|uniref:DUF2939 domain-containing protein n=1 Tax=uncultured Methylobacterium sp. TaxID=157278 RepID=UPI002638CFA3|nr:DUF2939 domain-containing protein [uncultured Methylobacterium sp.]
MRWCSAFLALILLWLAYGLSPYVALYRLSRSAQAHDVPAVAERVNFRTLRQSLARQATAAAVAAIAARRDLSAPERQMLTEAAASLAEPVVAALVTPEAVTDLLDDGWPQRLDLGAGETRTGDARTGDARAGEAAGEARRHRSGLHGASLGQLFALFRSAEPRGFRGIVVSYPPDLDRSEQYHLRLRLRGLAWRVVELDLPAALRDRLTQALVRLPRR